MKKIFRIIKTDGIEGLFRRVYKKITKKKNQKNIDFKMLDTIFKKKYNKIIIFENNFGWNQIMRQRPQQMAMNFNNDILFLYGSYYDEYKNLSRIDKIKSNLYLIDLNLYRKQIIKLLNKFNEKYLMIYSTDFVEEYILNKYIDNGFGVIYDYVDNIDRDLCNPQYYELLLSYRSQMLNSKYSFVVCTSTQLFKNAGQINENANIKLITNGVDYEHFNNRKTSKIKEIEKLKINYKFIIGYYGALASWFDYELIKKTAKNKDNLILLIGVDFDNTINDSGVLKLDNVKYLGKKDYNKLVYYANYFDICMIPFKINEITKATSPVKLFEYMALGKPIVTTNLNECKKYKSVFVSSDHEEFYNNIEKAKRIINDKKYLKLLDNEALKNTWKMKCQELINFIDETVKERKIKKTKYYPYTFSKKLYKYLKWHLWDKNKMYIKTNFIKIFDVHTKRMYSKEIKQILTENKYDRVIIWVSKYFGWNVGLFQRPQHVAMNMAQNGVLYFYDTSNKYDKVDTIKKHDNNLYLVNLNNKLYFDILLKEVSKINKPKYIHIYSTEMAMSLKEFKKIQSKGFNVIYEYIDDLSPKIAGTDELPVNIYDKYLYCMKDKRRTSVIVTADYIEKDVLQYREKNEYVYSCNGVNYGHFQISKDLSKVNQQMRKIIKQNKPIIGYYGALASWFDYDMIINLSIKKPEYNIVLIGVIYDKFYKMHNLEKYSNIHYLGPIDYKELPNYAVFFDVCTIPFIINEVTEATSPLKLFEYMALGKPIVTTSMHECKKYKSVMIANNKEEFIDLIDKGLNINNDNNIEYFKLLKKEALENTWEQKSKKILDYLKDSENN